MSIGPMNSLASAAGTHLAQTKGTDVDRATGDNEQAKAQSKIDGRAEGDASIDENHEATDRDADGRTIRLTNEEEEQKEENAESNEPTQETRRGKDARGELGNRLDITG